MLLLQLRKYVSACISSTANSFKFVDSNFRSFEGKIVFSWISNYMDPLL